MDWWRIVCCAAAGYLLGSCNGAIVVSHTCMHDDIRKKGSGNAGLTNFLRNFGGWATLLVVLMDMGKVVLACLLGRWLLPGNPQLGMMIAGAMTELGHIFPVFYGFRGGKGVVTTAAMMLLLDWRVFLICFAVFLLVFLKKRMVSLSSITAAAIYPVVTFCMTYFVDCCVGGLPVFYVVMATLVAALIGATVIIKHRANIKRIRNGTESTISFKKK
mgnify:CR=1 FL=1